MSSNEKEIPAKAEPGDTEKSLRSAADDGAEFIYVGDAMCSWCWGFFPTLAKIKRSFGLPIRVLNGGLRPGPYSQVLDDQFAGYLADHWVKVSEVSGQPFDTSFLERRDGWRFDSEMPAIAVVAMRKHRKDLALSFFEDIQHAFFADGVDITDPHRYPALLDRYPVEPAAFLDRMLDEEARKAAWKDFEEARSFGISSFPALLLKLDGKTGLVARGWTPFEELEGPLSNFFAKSGYEVAGNEACAVDLAC